MAVPSTVCRRGGGDVEQRVGEAETGAERMYQIGSACWPGESIAGQRGQAEVEFPHMTKRGWAS